MILYTLLRIIKKYLISESGAYIPLKVFDRRYLPLLINTMLINNVVDLQRNLTEYFNAIDANNMIVIFANMLNERRIIMTSKKLSRLSACVQAANALIYPMHWQHIFIPVLPNHLLDYLSAPMPFLIGVPSVIMNVRYVCNPTTLGTGQSSVVTFSGTQV